jgi:C-terminal processing protease CtpA/Prc
MRRLDRLLWILTALALGACGGGGGGGGGGMNPPPSAWTPGVFAPYTNFDALCVSPRTGTDPFTGNPFPDRSGTRTDQNNWLRSWTNDLYLWYGEVADQDPGLFTTPDYFELMMTTATTTSGRQKDQFHFSLSSADWFQLSQSGAQVGYGAAWVILAAVPPRRLVVAFTEPGTAASSAPASLVRGAEVLVVDGVDLVNDNTSGGVATLNAGLFPAASGEVHSFTVRDLNGAQRSLSMTSAVITSDPVQNVRVIPTPTGAVGYMLFNDHIAPSEAQLIDAVTFLQAQMVTDLVLDLRYNGGGFLDIASEMAYMIAGAARTSGTTFELLQFNDKHPTRDPVTGQLIAPIPFHQVSQGFSGPANQALPSLNLGRVYVLTGPDTCSASESIINSLRGVDVDVIQVGSTTCGKPYGFYATDNCGTTYFSIQFRGVNAKNFGDYADGFSPQNTIGVGGERIPGCSIADDFSQPLGDPAEGRLAAALGQRRGEACALPTGISLKTSNAESVPIATGHMPKSPWRENRILRN